MQGAERMRLEDRHGRAEGGRAAGAVTQSVLIDSRTISDPKPHGNCREKLVLDRANLRRMVPKF